MIRRPSVVGRRSGLVAIALVLLTSAVMASPLYARERPGAQDAWVIGIFAMKVKVTVAVGVRGEHTGQTLHRVWWLIPSRCDGSVCRQLTLYRVRSSHIVERVNLERVAPGRYAGAGAFYVPLECLGRRYQFGSRAPFRITLTVKASTQVQQLRFAERITATYVNRKRTDHTPCPLGPSHDAARYLGTLISPLPSPPVAGFTTAVNAATRTATFTDESSPGTGGVPVKTFAWQFGDPASGDQDSSTLADPVHQFTAPGSYSVTLEVINAYGLTSTDTQTVVVPAAA